MKQRGFTLIEVLVALMLVSMMSLLAWRSLAGMGRAGEAARRHEQGVQRLQIALEQWRADWNALDEKAAKSANLPSALAYDGQTVRMVRNSYQREAGFMVVAWTRRALREGNGEGKSEVKGEWQRWVSPAVNTKLELQQQWERSLLWSMAQQSVGAADADRGVSFFLIDSWQLFYYRGGAWTNPLSSGLTMAEGGAKMGGSSLSAETVAERLPDGVQLVLSLPANSPVNLTGKITHYWMAPTLGASQ